MVRKFLNHAKLEDRLFRGVMQHAQSNQVANLVYTQEEGVFAVILMTSLKVLPNSGYPAGILSRASRLRPDRRPGTIAGSQSPCQPQSQLKVTRRVGGVLRAQNAVAAGRGEAWVV